MDKGIQFIGLVEINSQANGRITGKMVRGLAYGQYGKYGKYTPKIFVSVPSCTPERFATKSTEQETVRMHKKFMTLRPQSSSVHILEDIE